MKKHSLILAVALATFTLTACGEKKQTPEEMKMIARQEREKALERLQKAGNDGNPQLTEKEIDSLVKVINKGRNENEYEMMVGEKPKPGEPAHLLKSSK